MLTKLESANYSRTFFYKPNVNPLCYKHQTYCLCWISEVRELEDLALEFDWKIRHGSEDQSIALYVVCIMQRKWVNSRGVGSGFGDVTLW